MKNNKTKEFKIPLVIENTSVKYSTILENFIEPFINDFDESFSFNDILEFSVSTWNLANMKLILPKNENNSLLDFSKNNDVDSDLLVKMIDYKISHFSEYTNFISDYELDINETTGDTILTVISQPQELFLNTMFESFEEFEDQNNHDENFINRSAIIIKPLKPFIDWCSNLYPDKLNDIKQTRTYLVSEEIDDLEAWLRKKFDKIFIFELETWNQNKKEWPQRRNYKMFKEWFQIEISTFVFDFEKQPILKSF